MPEAARQWKQFHDEAERSAENGDLIEAERLARACLAISESIFGQRDPRLAASCDLLGVILEQRGRPEDAEKFLRRGLSMLERLVGPQHPYVLKANLKLGGFYRRIGRRNQAELVLTKTLQDSERQFGKNDPALVEVLSQLGGLLGEMGRYSEAQPLLQRVVQIRESNMDTKTDTASLDTLNGFIETQLKKRNYGEAELLAREWLQRRETMLPRDDPDRVSDLSRVAQISVQARQYDGALKYLSRAVDLAAEIHGKESMEMMRLLRELGSVNHMVSNDEKAAECYELIMTIAQANGLDKDIAVATDMQKLGLIYAGMNKLDKAIESTQAAVKIREQLQDPDHLEIVALLKDLADLYREHGDEKEAAELDTKIQSVFEQLAKSGAGAAEAAPAEAAAQET